MSWTYTCIALHISSAVFPAFLNVMARFLALFASSNVTLLDPFCVIFCLLEDRSMAGPWAFVLNISSNSSTFKSWSRERWDRQTRLQLKIKCKHQRTDFFYSILPLIMAYSIFLFVLQHDIGHTYISNVSTRELIPSGQLNGSSLLTLQGWPPQTRAIYQTRDCVITEFLFTESSIKGFFMPFYKWRAEFMSDRYFVAFTKDNHNHSRIITTPW